MLTTGILTLNIHDSLTFDGTEICLNPDLFTTTDHGGGSSQRTNSAGIGASSIGSGNSAGTSNVSSTGLSVGDIIEIRVWDPLPKEAGRVNSPATSSIGTRKRFQQAPILPTATMPMQGSGLFGRDNNSTVGGEGSTLEPGGTIPSLRPRTAFYPTSSFQQPVSSDQFANDGQKSITLSPKSGGSNHSLRSSSDQYEEGTKTKTATNDGKSSPIPAKTVAAPILQSNSFNASTTPTTTNSSINISEPNTQQHLPPVFPRNRLTIPDTSNAHALSANKPPKPLTLAHRRASSTAGAIPTPQRSPKQQRQQQNASLPSTRHRRDISDMTADTTYQLDNIFNDAMNSHRPDSPDTTLDEGATTGSSHNETLLKISSTHRLRLSFVLTVMEKTLTSFKGNSRTQISVLRQVADLYNLSNYDLVTVHKIEPQDEEEVMKAVSADFVVVTIKDQFISRGDMLLFQAKLIGTWIYEGQRLFEPTRNIKAHAREIRHGNFSAKSGIVTEKTNITFRSRSARIVWLVQLSSEMWEYSSPYERQNEPESVCEIYFDQWIRFLYKLFKKWKDLEVTHSLTVIFFSRTFLSKGLQSSLDCQDVYGRRFEDHYKPVIENETCIDWDSLIVRIKEEFTKYPLEVGWNLSDRKPSCASQGNLLEAINVVLNLMQYHYLDRDLHRTGQSIVIVSPGCGVFEVDKGLAGITYQRMMDNGIGSDMLSLGLPPLHIAPFFLYNNEIHTVQKQGIDESEVYYEIPHWMHLSFVIYDRPEEKRVYLSGLESKTTRVQTGHWLDAYDIGANGFLRPNEFREPTMDSQLLNSKKVNTSSFSAAGNMAATPGKAKVVQQQGQARQLISGRKFTDILEACRPRILGATIPSPLENLLTSRHFANGNRAAKGKDAKDVSVEKKDSRLREWGTIDFSDFSLHSRLKATLGSPGVRRSIRNHSIIHSDRSSINSGDDGSHALSLGSKSSSIVSAYGTSFDRVFWDYYESPNVPAKAFQMQRSASIEYDELGKSVVIDGGPGTTDDSSTISDNISKGSLGGDSETNLSVKSKIDRHTDHLKKIMDSYNTMVCQTPHDDDDELSERNQWHDSTMLSPEPEVARTMKGGGLVHTIRQRGKDNIEPAGGLGAALTQYSVDKQVSVIQERPSTLLKRRASGGHYLTSGSKTTTFNSERRRAASPLLFRSQQQDRPGTPKLFSSLMPPTNDPPNILRSGQPRPVAIHRPLPNEKISGRKRSNSVGGPPKNIIPQVSISSGSRIMLDPNRYNNLPSSRSPPSNAGYLSTTPRGVMKLQPQSPPKVTAAQDRSGSGLIRAIARSPPLSGNSTEKDVSHTPPKVSNLLKERSASPHLRNTMKVRERSGSSKPGGRDSPLGSVKTPIASRRKKAFNPFRQSDEDKVLAKRSHNRRRWSHVYPEGEVEFKRHAGPIWNSLTSPAILPLSVDHFPTPQELKDENSFQFSFYQVTLRGVEDNHYEKHADLLKEMVRQRVTQDFQIVTDAAIAESKKRATESQREGRNVGKPQSRSSSRVETFTRPLPSMEEETSGGTKHHYLSMGHKIQVMNYDPSSDTIEIVLYNRKSAQNDRENTHTYKFFLFSKVTQQYTASVQTFKKYSEPYKWNRVDNLICGEADRTMDVGMRFRRVMFGLIPETFKNPDDEEEYVAKFRKLLSYLEKLRDNDGSKSKLNVEIITTKTKKDKSKQTFSKTRQDMTETMIRFPVQLLRGKKDPFEWIEVAISATFDTTTSFRIIFNWLVASSAKVETQVQLLQRRFKNFGLKFISFPQTTVSWDLFIHALAAPTFITIRDPPKAKRIEDALLQLDFMYDGVTMTSPQFLECIDNSEDFRFPHYRSGRVKAIPAPQFVHHSGAIFIRKLTDREGKVILVGIENYRHASVENKFRQIAISVIKKVLDLIESLPSSEIELDKNIKIGITKH